MDDKLHYSAAKFNLACLNRLNQKGKEGRKGWDNPKFESVIAFKICDTQPDTQKIKDAAIYWKKLIEDYVFEGVKKVIEALCECEGMRSK